MAIGAMDKIQVRTTSILHLYMLSSILLVWLTLLLRTSTQKLHVRTVPLHEQPRRIAHLESTRTFLVAITVVTMSVHDGVVDSLRLLDDQTFETLDVFKLESHETPCSLSTMQFANHTENYYAVGTAFVLPEESEPRKVCMIS